MSFINEKSAVRTVASFRFGASPAKEMLQNQREFALVTGAVPHAVLHLAMEPLQRLRKAACVDVLCNPQELPIQERSSNEVNFHPPAGVITRLDANAVTMLPFAIALLGIPCL